MIKRIVQWWNDPDDIDFGYKLILGLLYFKIVVILISSIFFVFMNIQYGTPIPKNFPSRGF